MAEDGLSENRSADVYFRSEVNQPSCLRCDCWRADLFSVVVFLSTNLFCFCSGNGEVELVEFIFDVTVLANFVGYLS